MATESPAFERIYQDYLQQLAELNFTAIAEKLGGRLEGETIIVPFFGRPHRISPAGIQDPAGRRPSHSVSVVLSKYLLMCPENEPRRSDWVSYKDFKDAGPFVGGFRNNAEVPIERAYGSRPSDLETACTALAGCSVREEFPYEVAMRMAALPKVPLLLLLNSSDEELPARCAMLFEARAEQYLDMECLAMCGWALSHYLCGAP